MVLLSVSRGYSIVKGMFPRVTNPSAAPHRSEALDLHVLGLPPAFVLSQDQTLKLNAVYTAILDVRTSAHLQIGLTETNLHFLCLMYFQLTKLTKSHTNSEADTTSSDRNPSGVDIQTSDPSN